MCRGQERQLGLHLTPCPDFDELNIASIDMGSVEAACIPAVGTFEIAVYESAINDPSERPYLAAPRPSRTVEKSYPLINFRREFGHGEDGLDSRSKSADVLSKLGFTAARHRSALLSPPYTRIDLDSIRRMDEIYYPEIETLVKELTGCRYVFITHSFLRGPKPAEGLKAEQSQNREFKASNMSSDYLNLEKPLHNTDPLPPTRLPHSDCTPLGGRRAIRYWRSDIHEAAVEAGIIAAEDSICEKHGVKATSKDSDPAITAEYNVNGKCGPRYAAYSVWRPIKKVTRDPLAMAPRRSVAHCSDEMYLWQYDIRNMGRYGDWNKELEMLRIRHHVVGEAQDGVDETIDWYYLPDQETDEVLVFKLFDSAALDESAEEAEGAPHGSPDLGDRGHGGPRESIEVRLFAIW